MTSFSEVVFTPSFMPRLLHVFMASWTAGAALMVSVSAGICSRPHLDLAKANMKVALAGFILFATANFGLMGPSMAIEVTNEQPLKLASMEGLWESTSCAPLYLVGWVDEATQTTTGISIPCLLSVLAYFNPQATVQGINSMSPPDPTPPISLVFQVYHFMFDIGSLFVPIGLLAGLLYWRKPRLFTARWMLWILVVTVFFVEAAIIAGWWTAEVGRQPWVVYNVLKTADGVSPTLSGLDVAISLGMFIALYAILFALFLYLLNRAIQHGPEPLEDVETIDRATLPDTFREIFTRRDRAGSSGDT